MKKRLLSILLMCCMVLTLLPTAAFAEDSTETPPVCSCETACTVDNMNKECPVCGAENAIPQNCGQYIPVEDRTGENGSTERADDPNGPTELSAADQVQAMIDGLPNAEEITEENAEEVEAQLEAIDEAKEKLSDEEIDELDMTRYAEAAAALGALAAPMLLANDSPDEQFSLAPGGRYYFDLSAMNIPGTANSNLPDSTLHYVPFTYAGTVDAYKLTSAMATTDGYAEQNKYAHSLFVADYAVTHTVSWDDLNTKGLIFGKNYASGGVDYTMRAPSAGSQSNNNGKDDSSTRGIPKSNEWDAILDKANQDWKDNTSGYIKNWSRKYSFGQDNHADASIRAVRGHDSARYWRSYYASYFLSFVGFRPVLEVLNPDELGADALKAVTLDLGGGKLGGSTDAIQIIVKNGSTFTAPMSGGLTRPDGDTGSYFMWLDGNGNSYEPGDSVPADVTTLTVQWTVPTYAVTLHPNGGTINSGNVTEYTYGVGATLPTDVTRTGYTFKGWYDNEGLTGNPVTAIGGAETGNKEYWAKWEANTYTVTLNTNGGTINSGNVTGYTYGVGATLPTADDMTYTGYTFKGWYDNEGLTGFPVTAISDTETGNKEYWAKWEANAYTVTLNTNGGTINNGNVTEYTYGVGATLPTDVTRTGYTFKGWYDNENLTGSPVTAIGGTEMGNKEYWAKWEINQYTITFDTAGGSVVTPITQNYGTAITAPADPTKNGYTFVGWNPEIPATMPAEDLTVTAQWTLDLYTISYNLNNGTATGNPDSYTVESDAITLNTPTRPGYTFTGWSGTGLDGENNMTVTIPTGSTGNRTYTAHWRYNGSGHSYSYYTIKATAGAGGSISPSGNVSVREGRDQTFTITPDKGYAVANVKIDGKSIGAVKSYTFENVRRTHTIEVIFMKANGNPQTGVFVDVATGSYYEDAVDWAVENGITQGTDDTHFSPDGICTRAQAVTFLWRTAGSPKPETRTMPFTDVPAGSYYYDAVLWAVENGITKGTSDTTFSPNMTCTRAQIVAFLWRSEKSPAAGTANPFADVKSTAYYAGAVLWAVREDITKGTTSTTFSPDADCTRAQIVTFLWRCKK